MSKDRIKLLLNKLQPYVNGKLITTVFIRYWEELKELIELENKEEKDDYNPIKQT